MHAQPVADLHDATVAGFEVAFGRKPRFVGRAPGRVNLIGEHTDYNGGLCLPVALEQATWAAVAPRADGTLRFVSAQRGAWTGTDPVAATGWAAYVAGVVWALREDGLEVPGLDVYVDSTVPVGAGLSSSAALECAVAVALADDVSRHRLVAACLRAETEIAGAPTGGLDQTVALHARPGHALLLDFADGSRRQVRCDPGADGLALLVVDTRVHHELTTGSYGDRRAECHAAADALGGPLRSATLADADRLDDPVLRRRARHVVSENERVTAAVSCLATRDWEGLGRLLVASHASLRDDFEVSCVELDTAVDAARAAGALGARMTGGGFGGSAVALVPADRLEAVRSAVDRAADAAGQTRPAYLLAAPSGAAHRC